MRMLAYGLVSSLALAIAAPAARAAGEVITDRQANAATAAQKAWLDAIVARLTAVGYEVRSARFVDGSLSLEVRYRGPETAAAARPK